VLHGSERSPPLEENFGGSAPLAVEDRSRDAK